jgi:molybdate transport system substrate-binding protein
MKVQDLSTFGVLLLCLGAVSCETSENAPKELVVSAAISLKGTMEDLAGIFEERHSDVQIRLNFGASGILSSQIERGAPVDVYASASVVFLQELQKGNHLLGNSWTPLAGNRLVLIGSLGSTPSSVDWTSLGKTKRIALGNPKTVPAGAYAKECLQNLELWEDLTPRFIFAEHVRQVLDYVARGEVEVGLVYATDAMILPDDVRVLAEAPKDSHSPIEYGIAVVATSEMADVAQRFVELSLSSVGRDVLISYGFTAPGK